MKKVHKQTSTLTDHLLKKSVDDLSVHPLTDQIIKQTDNRIRSFEHSVLIFLLSNELFAISTSLFSEVIETRPIHKVPFRNHSILLGIVNYKGQLKPCVSLHCLLGIDDKASLKFEQESFLPSYYNEYEYFLVIQKKDDLWVFPVNKVYGICNYDVRDLKEVPKELDKPFVNHLRGFFVWQNESVGIFDEENLFQELKRSLL